MIRIGIVDPYEIPRKAVASLAEAQGGIQVVADASNIAELIPHLEQTSMDVLLLEPLAAWGLNLAAVQAARDKCRDMQVMVFSDSTEEEHLQSALRAGVKGFVSKRARLSELINGIQHLARGEPFLCAEVTARLTRCIIHAFSRPPHEMLSSREFEIFLLLVNGKTISEAAGELHLSVKTISTHKTRLMQKMGVDSFSKLVQYASVHGLISHDGMAASG